MIVIGSGLGGALLALALGQRGIPCEVYELREDLRDNPTLSAGKSINLALSTRGLTALASVGVDGPVRAMCTPMVGRMLHDRDGKTRIQYYSADHKHHIDSVSRGGINCLLMDEAEKHPMVKFYYEHKCERVDLQNMEVHFQTKDGAKITRKAQTIFGADGFHSRVREAMMRVPRFDFSIKHLHVGYKELEFPAADSPERAVEDGKYRFKKNFLHIWPRGPFMVIALANLDGSFTVTCFFPHDGANGFDVLDKAADQAIMDFFFLRIPRRRAGAAKFATRLPRKQNVATCHDQVRPLGSWGQGSPVGRRRPCRCTFFRPGYERQFRRRARPHANFRSGAGRRSNCRCRLGIHLSTICELPQAKWRRNRGHGGRKLLRNGIQDCRPVFPSSQAR